MTGTEPTVAMRRWPFALMLGILAWLPFQNFVLACLFAWFILPLGAAQALTLAKEAGLAGLLIILLLSGRLWRWGLLEIVFGIYLLWLVCYLPLGGLSLTARVAGLRVLAIPVMLYLVGRYLPAPSWGTKVLLRIVLATSLIVALAGWIDWLLISPTQMAVFQSASALIKGQSLAVLPNLPGPFYAAIGSAFTGELIWVRRMISTYLEPLTLGHALILPFTLLYYALVGPRPRLVKPRLAVAGLLVFIAITQVAAFSRGAIIASLLAAGLLTITVRRARLPSMLILVLGLAMAMLVPRLRAFVINTIRLEDPSTIAHVSQLDLGVQIARQHPLGLGLGQGGYVGDQYAGGQAQGSSESFYFSLMSQVGLGPMLLYSLGVLLLLWHLGWMARHSASHQLRGVLLVTLAALAGYSFSAIFSEAALGMLASASVWFLAGHVVQLGRREREARRAGSAAAA